MITAMLALALLQTPTTIVWGITSGEYLALARGETIVSTNYAPAVPQTPTVPTGPVVRMTGPVPYAVDMFADGSTVVYKQPVGTIPRVPPQDSNDVAQKFAMFACDVAVYASTPSIQALLDKHKIKCQ